MTNILNKSRIVKICAAAAALLACFALTACSLFGPPEATPPPAPTVEQSAAPVESTPTPEPAATPAPTFKIATDRHDAIYNNAEVRAVHLTMAKAKLEEEYPPGPITDNGYTTYDDYGFFVKYYGNDTVKELVVYGSSDWETFCGIACGSTYSDIVSAYGEPLFSDGNTHSYYSLDNELLAKIPSFAKVDINYLYTISFIVEGDVVTCIMISKM